MKIIKSTFKDVPCHRVICGMFTATYLSQYGGKLVSLIDREHGIEWLAQDPNESYIPQTINGNYVESEVSGADEMFPTIDPCVCDGVAYPCHGEVCRVKQSETTDGESLTIGYRSEKLGFSYEKRISEGKNGEIVCEYHIKNQNQKEFPCLWALHFMFSATEGGSVFANTAEDADAELMFDDRKKYGARGTTRKLEKKMMQSGSYVRGGDAYKFYITQPLAAGICGYYRDAYHGGVRLRYDAKKLPYLGVWINDGGFKEMYSAAVEPCNIPYDAVTEAMRRGYRFCLAPGETLTFSVILEKISKI